MSEFEQYLALMPFAETVGVQILSATPAEVIGALDWAPQRTTGAGTLHGGALMTLADCMGALCAYLNLAPQTSTTTTSSSTVFLRAVRGGRVTATSRPLHVGRSTIAVSTELRDEEGRLVAQVTQSQAVLAARH